MRVITAVCVAITLAVAAAGGAHLIVAVHGLHAYPGRMHAIVSALQEGSQRWTVPGTSTHVVAPDFFQCGRWNRLCNVYVIRMACTFTAGSASVATAWHTTYTSPTT